MGGWVQECARLSLYCLAGGLGDLLELEFQFLARRSFLSRRWMLYKQAASVASDVMVKSCSVIIM